MTMADLLAKNDKNLSVTRGQELTGEIVEITDNEVILDLGRKAEGVLPKRDLSEEQEKTLKVGDKLQVFVLIPENESGQVVLALKQLLPANSKFQNSSPRWDKFQQALGSSKTFTAKGIEVNKGGLIVEAGEVRGFVPSSQVSLSQVDDLSALVGKEIQVTVIEVDPNQNRLIFSQKSSVSEEVKEKLTQLKVGDSVKGKVAAVLPFGIFVSLENGVEGLVHISELAWEKVEDPTKLFKVGDEVNAQVISVDSNTNRVNLSIKQLQNDPFVETSKKYNADQVIKGKVSKISSNGVYISLEEGIEGILPANKQEQGVDYQVGQEITVTVDSVYTQKRRITLSPFITSTADLIYK